MPSRHAARPASQPARNVACRNAASGDQNPVISACRVRAAIVTAGVRRQRAVDPRVYALCVTPRPHKLSSSKPVATRPQVVNVVQPVSPNAVALLMSLRHARPRTQR